MSELDLYAVDHVNAPLNALLILMSKLKAWHCGSSELLAKCALGSEGSVVAC